LAAQKTVAALSAEEIERFTLKKVNEWSLRYGKARPRWKQECQELEQHLRTKLELLNDDGRCFVRSITTRTKDLGSLIRSAHSDWLKLPQAKRGTFDWDYITSRKDIRGVRIVGLNLRDVVTIVRWVVSDAEFGLDRHEIRNYYEEVKKTRYRSWQVPLHWSPRQRQSSRALRTPG